MYRVEAAGLSFSNYAFKIIAIFWEIWDSFVKDWYFVNNRLI